MPTDPRSTRKPSQGSVKQSRSPAKKPSAHSAARSAEPAHIQQKKKPQAHRDGHAPVKKNERSGEYRSAGHAKKSRAAEDRRAPQPQKLDQNAARYAYDARNITPKKKKKSKFKRFWKNLGREIQALGDKLAQAKEAPTAQTAYAERNDLGFPQKKSASASDVGGKIKKGLLAGVRTIARGLYLGVRGIYQFLMKLPSRTLLIASSAFGLVVVAVIVLALALPGKPSKADGTDQLAAYTALESEPSALESAAIDRALADAAADGANESTDAAVEQTGVAVTAGTEDASAYAGELKEGDNDEIIATLQTKLMELGYMDSDEPTQHFGPLTQSALMAFQRHNGLDDDGIFGQATYELLMSESAKIYVMQLGDKGPDVEGVQQRLYELGYLDNKANIQGVFGDKTESAAKEFQKKNDLTADGKVGVRTLEMLYGEDVVSNAFRLGDENPVIKDCQTALKKLGYVTFKPDGVMGKATVTAIKAFQQANGLTRDGALGPVTRDLILSGDAQAMVMQLGDYGTDVKNMQKRLAELNYISSANATGYFGEITEDAVMAFQKRMGLTADGKVGGVTLSIMKSSKAKKAVTTPSTSKETSSGSSSSSSGSSGSSSGGSSSAVINSTGVEKLVALAQSKIGSKYVRGAKGPNTFDCSGFVYWCLKSSGVSTSYMTSIAWRTTSRFQRISSTGSIQRGDILVFSGSTATDGHVGIYIGGGKMIDASSSEGQVRQSSSVLNSGGYWQQHFICAYRVF